MDFADYILFEAFSQKKAVNKIGVLLPQVCKHFMKLWFMKDSLCVLHWKVEIRNWLDSIQTFSRTKNKSKNLSFNKLEKNIEYPNRSRVRNWRDSIIEEYRLKNCEYKIDILVKQIEKLYKEIFIEISKNELNITDLIKKFESLK